MLRDAQVNRTYNKWLNLYRIHKIIDAMLRMSPHRGRPAESNVDGSVEFVMQNCQNVFNVSRRDDQAGHAGTCDIFEEFRGLHHDVAIVFIRCIRLKTSFGQPRIRKKNKIRMFCLFVGLRMQTKWEGKIIVFSVWEINLYLIYPSSRFLVYLLVGLGWVISLRYQIPVRSEVVLITFYFYIWMQQNLILISMWGGCLGPHSQANLDWSTGKITVSISVCTRKLTNGMNWLLSAESEWSNSNNERIEIIMLVYRIVRWPHSRGWVSNQYLSMWSKVNIRIALLAPNSSVTHSLINYVDEIWRKRHCPTGAKKKKKKSHAETVHQ